MKSLHFLDVEHQVKPILQPLDDMYCVLVLQIMTSPSGELTQRFKQNFDNNPLKRL